MVRTRKVISSIMLCPLARECKNNTCILRALKIHGYPITPSTKAEQDKVKEIEKNIGRAYLPIFETRVRNNQVEVVCPDFME